MPANIVDQIGLDPNGGAVIYTQAPVYRAAAYRPPPGAVLISPETTPQTQRGVVQLTTTQQQMMGPPLMMTQPQMMQVPMGMRGGANMGHMTSGGSERVADQLFGSYQSQRDPGGIALANAAAGRAAAQAQARTRAQPLVDGGDGNDSITIFQFGDQVERVLDAAVDDINEISESSIMNMSRDLGLTSGSATGLGVGGLDGLFEQPGGQPEIHTSEQAAAETNQEEVLDEEERTELDKYNHPLSDEWVKKLPPYDEDLKPAEMCVRDCKERTRIHDLECDEVRRRVTKRLNDLGCLTRWVAIPQKSPCS